MQLTKNKKTKTKTKTKKNQISILKREARNEATELVLKVEMGSVFNTGGNGIS